MTKFILNLKSFTFEAQLIRGVDGGNFLWNVSILRDGAVIALTQEFESEYDNETMVIREFLNYLFVILNKHVKDGKFDKQDKQID